jgi:AcrR family transcriptional regulator
MNPVSADRSVAAAAAAPARVGRPPRVNLQLIVDAALAIGLDRVSLPMVADKLGVGSSTLYRHVRNRDELLRLATVKLTLERRLPAGTGLHWSELAARYAENLYESLAREPLVIQELMRGRLGPDIEVDYLEPFLQAMSLHGFSPGEGLHLFRAIGMLAVGAAAAATAQQARIAAGDDNDAFARVLAERAAGELPLIRAALSANVDMGSSEWKMLLQYLLAGFAAARGETLPC